MKVGELRRMLQHVPDDQEIQVEAFKIDRMYVGDRKFIVTMSYEQYIDIQLKLLQEQKDSESKS